jgi:hypothetical protein
MTTMGQHLGKAKAEGMLAELLAREASAVRQCAPRASVIFAEATRPCAHWSDGQHVIAVDGLCRCGKRFVLLEVQA